MALSSPSSGVLHPETGSAEEVNNTWSTRIGQVRGELDALRAPCEQSFLTVGEELAVAHRTTRSLAEGAADLSEVFSQGELMEQARRLEGDLRALEQTLATSSNEAGLSTINKAAQGIGGSVEALGKLLVQVRMLAMNARIEAAQLSGLGMDFAVFTREIGRLADRGEKSIGIITGTLRTLRDSLERALELQNTMGEQHRKDLEGIHDRLRLAIDTLHQRREVARQTLSLLPSHLEKARRSVSEVVSALQIADMTRQRVEHVEEALNTVLEVLAEQRADEDMGGQRRHIMVNALCDLQSRQLAVIRDDFEAKARIIESNLFALGHGVEALRGGVTRLHASGHEEEGGKAFLTDLEQDLESAQAILERYQAARRETEASMGTVAAMTGEIAQTVAAINEIDAEMHLIGLNASIKCGNLGTRGRVLTVIASELQAFARQTRALAVEIGGRLGDISEVSATLGTPVAGNEGQDLLTGLGTAIQAFLATLTRVMEETEQRLAGLQEQTEALEHSLDNTLRNFTIRQRMTEVFTRAATQLDGIAQACRPAVNGPALDEARREVLEFLHQHYTMVNEREVHEALFGASPASASSPPSPSAPSPSAMAPSPAGSPPAGEPDISDFLF
ncbi:hypothetical protein [Pararhodospirillum oryzae]|nr:hypothetical protein [Pararhodospirillum oryzae]